MPHPTPNKSANAPIAVTIQEAVRIAGIGRSKMYEAIGSGHLPAYKLGKRTLIMVDDLEGWLRGLPRSKSAAPPPTETPSGSPPLAAASEGTR